MEIDLAGDVLHLRFDGRVAQVSDPEHVMAFKRLLEHPSARRLLAFDEEGDDGDYDNPHGFDWFDQGIWAAALSDPNQAPWIVIQRDDMARRYVNDTAAADANFAEVQYHFFNREPRPDDVEEVYYEPGSSVGVVLARGPTTEAGKAVYAQAMSCLPEIIDRLSPFGSPVGPVTRVEAWRKQTWAQAQFDEWAQAFDAWLLLPRLSPDYDRTWLTVGSVQTYVRRTLSYHRGSGSLPHNQLELASITVNEEYWRCGILRRVVAHILAAAERTSATFLIENVLNPYVGDCLDKHFAGLFTKGERGGVPSYVARTDAFQWPP